MVNPSWYNTISSSFDANLDKSHKYGRLVVYTLLSTTLPVHGILTEVDATGRCTES